MRIKMVKSNIIMFILIICTNTFIVSCDSGTRAEYPYYSNTEELFMAADVILEGIIQKTYTEDININIKPDAEYSSDDVYTYTISEVKVEDVLKGEVKKGDIIKIKQLGTETIMNEEIKKGGGYYKKNSKYIFFLTDFKNGSPMSVLNPAQGNVEIIDNKLKLTDLNKEIFKDEDLQKLKDNLKKLK